jgi:prolyl oligopeptidase PreP (S9A serine peptidase family)
LEQSDAATAARTEWVEKHNKDFDRWFDESHTDKEIEERLGEMIRTQMMLLRVMDSLRNFYLVGR